MYTSLVECVYWSITSGVCTEVCTVYWWSVYLFSNYCILWLGANLSPAVAFFQVYEQLMIKLGRICSESFLPPNFSAKQASEVGLL